jgi:Fe-S oxidoreductase/nitrate reductase gamma subunit
MHLGIFYGFIVLTIGTLMIALQDHFKIPVFDGANYLLISLMMDLFGLAALIGTIMAIYKRYIDKPDHEEYNRDDAVVLILILLLMVTGFLLEGLRIYSTRDIWAGWTPVGYLLSLLIQSAGISAPTAQSVHRFLWYFHMLIAFGGIAYLPYSKLFHVLPSSLNLMLRPAEIGRVTKSDTDGQSVDGVGALKDFTRKQLLELDACVSCLRCEKGCPAYMSGAPLSPRKVIKDLKNYSNETFSIFKFKNKNKLATSLVNRVVARETLLACTTCGLCEDKCPVKIEHIKRIIDLRRNLITQESGYPPEIEQVFNNIFETGNLWGLRNRSKFDFPNEHRIPLLSEKKKTDILYWVGCYGLHESRSSKVTEAMFRIFARAGVDFSILGQEERCCGDKVRRLGNELLFQQLAMDAIATLNRYEFKAIVTTCPHCYHVLKNEYPEYGGDYQVFHHSEYIRELLRSGQINVKGMDKVKVTYHDPCYLGRYNEIYDAPRDVLTLIQGLSFTEMKNNQVRAFCCGAGGGRILLNDCYKENINDILLGKGLKTKVAALVSACPLCLTTLTEAVSRTEEELRILDIAEIVDKALK